MFSSLYVFVEKKSELEPESFEESAEQCVLDRGDN